MAAPRRYFGTDGIRGRVGTEPITEDFVCLLGRALARTLCDTSPLRVLIGRDTRASGPELTRALCAGLSAEAAQIELCGVMPTPAVSYLTRSSDTIDLGIVVSASHNPHHDNGIKLFAADGGRLSEDTEAAIEQTLEQLRTDPPADTAHALTENPEPYAQAYLDFCRTSCRGLADLSGRAIVMDCANGAGFALAPQLLTDLGADCTVIAGDPDGRNINDGCGATHTESILDAVAARPGSIGMTLDGDADRLLMVDEEGQLLDGDDLLYILARARQQAGAAFGGVVGTEMTNLGLVEALAAHTIPFAAATVGDRNVMALMCHNNWALGGEPSGHIICRELGPTGDGLLTALQVFLAAQTLESTLADMKRDIQKFPQVTVNVPCPANWQPDETVADAAQAVRDTLGTNGRVVVRRSGTEALLRVMVEARTTKQAQQQAERIAAVARAEAAA